MGESRFTVHYSSSHAQGELRIMVTLRKTIPVLCLATSLVGIAAYAQTATTATPAAAAAGAPGHHWHHHRHHGGMFFVLHKLNLSPEQKTQIKGIMAGEKSQFQALHTSVKTNRTALATTPPTDPGYPALLQTAKTNASTRIQLESETWSAIYSNVLSRAQQQAIPGIVAAAQQAREARMAAWTAQHPQAAPSAD
jgi:Spy/CpxP family protein refolding chaperone